MKTPGMTHQMLLIAGLSLMLSACGSSEKKPEEKLVDKAKAEQSGGAEDMKLKVGASDEAQVDEGGASDAPATWTYEGALGPANWGSISKSYSTCEIGQSQSPIDLKWRRPSGTKSLRFMYAESPIMIGNNGRFIEILLPQGQKAMLDGTEFELFSVQFHTPSEHKFSGKEFPAELAMVHRDASGRKAIVSVMLTAGKANAALNRILPQIPTEKGRRVEVAGESFHPLALMPVNYNHYHYMGSDTLPPCAEGVLHVVLNTPVEASKDQLAKLRSFYIGNRRPVQNSTGQNVELFYGQ